MNTYFIPEEYRECLVCKKVSSIATMLRCGHCVCSNCYCMFKNQGVNECYFCGRKMIRSTKKYIKKQN